MGVNRSDTSRRGLCPMRLLDKTGPAWLLTTIGVLLVALGGLSFLIAHRSYRTARAREAGGLSHLVTGSMVALLALVSAAGVFLIVNARGSGFQHTALHAGPCRLD
jgi:uncharacterized membrane protein YhhN